jgi:hypothetical protein
MGVARLTLRLVALLALSLALGGCLVSKRPLFSEATAVTPVAAGRYLAYEATDTGYKPDDPITIRRNGRGYEMVGVKGNVTPATLHPLAGDRFVVQFLAEDRKTWGYTVVRINGDTIYSFAAICSQQNKAKLEPLGVELTREYCWLDKVRDPKAVFALVKADQPLNKLERDKSAGPAR